MKSIDLADAPILQPLIQPGNSEPILVTSGGRTIAAVVPMTNDDDLEDIALSRSPAFNAILNRSQERLESEGGLTPDEVRRRLGL
jgi:antitoxin (DNA-binding transcriptional repressor) of toxin-antitoxin stability system